MARRIKITTLVAPNGIYQREALTAHGYRPSPTSRFAVTRVGEGPWTLTHVRSGGGMDSIFPARAARMTMTQKLAFAAACEAATHLDWSEFDALPAITEETTSPPTFIRAPHPAMVAELRVMAERAAGLS